MIFAGLYDLCDPAYYYLLISLSIVILIGLQNIGNHNRYCVGIQMCPTSNVYIIFIVKVLYILVFTWILNLLCKNELGFISWILILIPIILMLLFIALYFINVAYLIF